MKRQLKKLKKLTYFRARTFSNRRSRQLKLAGKPGNDDASYKDKAQLKRIQSSIDKLKKEIEEAQRDKQQLLKHIEKLEMLNQHAHESVKESIKTLEAVSHSFAFLSNALPDSIRTKK